MALDPVCADDQGSSGSNPSGAPLHAALERTDAYWRDWVAALRYSGPRKSEVLRSAITTTS